MRIHRFLLWGLLAYASSSQAVFAQATDVSGRWVGRTQCPAGVVSFTIDVEGSSGTLSHGGFGPEKKYPASHPINIRFMSGHEGEWVYFQKATPGHASFSDLNGLLSRDGQSAQVRRGVSIGDCQPFVLSRARPAQKQAQAPAQAPSPAASPQASPRGREPTENEIRSALEYALHGEGDSFRVDNPLNGIRATISYVEKLGCAAAQNRPGYLCDYLVEVDTQFYSNEGTAAGHNHAQAVQALFGMLQGAHTAGPQASTGRFLYAESRQRWMKMSD